MKNTKRMISAAMALVLCLMLMPAGIVSAAEVQTGGYENGNGLDLNKIGSYISGISNPDGGVAEIVSYDAVENKAWVVNGATGMLDILDLNNMEDGAISATSLDIKALAAEVNPGFFYGDMTSVSVCADLRLVAVALQAEDYDAAGYVANPANYCLAGIQYNEANDAYDSDTWCLISYGKNAATAFISNFYDIYDKVR